MTRPLLLLSLLVSTLHLQANTTANTSEAWCQQAQEFTIKSDLDSIVLFFEQTIDSVEKTKEWEKGGDCYKTISKVLLGKNKKSLNISKEEKKKVNQELVRLLDICLQQLKNEKIVQNEIIGELYVYLALSYRRLENYPIALKHYEIAIDIFESIRWDAPIVAFAYKNAAWTCSRMLERNRQKNYLLKALRLKNNKKYINSVNNSLVTLYAYLGTQNAIYYDSAYLQYQIALKMVKNEDDLAELQINVISVLAALDKNNEALKAAQEALQYFQQNDISKHIDNAHIALGIIYQNLQQKNKAIHHYTQALEWAEKNSKAKNRDKVNLHTTFGDAYQKWGDTLQALQHYQQALIQVFPNFNETDIHKNPPLKEVYQESWIMTAAAKKAELLQNRYEKSGDINDLKIAAESYALSLEAIQLLHQSYSADTSKHYLSDYSHDYYEQALHANFLLYTQTQEKEYLDAAFHIMEQSKAKSLKEAIVRNEVFKKLPDFIKRELRDLELKILEAENFEENKTFDSLSLVLKNRKHKIENTPEFFNLFSALALEIPTIDLLQQQMPNTHFVEYFWGKEHLYQLQINGERVELDTLPSSNKSLQSYLKLLQNGGNNLKHYSQLAHELYQNYCGKWLDKESLEGKIIAVIPDSLLNFLPFESLLTDTTHLKDENKSPFDFDFPQYWSYLLYQAPIQYAFSTSTLLQSREQKGGSGEILGFFPNFEGKQKLNFQELEKTWLEKRFEGNYLSLDARTSYFQDFAPHASVLHLSTHAYASKPPRIDFADTSLYLPSLYNMQLSADLVVLSACETNLGSLVKGEGAMSLARGFVYSGASSLMASLWAVDEKSTQDIIQAFYTYLEEGKPKAEALQLAKLAYLQEAGTKNDTDFLPYYWAGMVYIGGNTALELQSTHNFKWQMMGLIGLGISLLFGVGYYWRKKSVYN